MLGTAFKVNGQSLELTATSESGLLKLAKEHNKQATELDKINSMFAVTEDDKGNLVSKPLKV